MAEVVSDTGRVFRAGDESDLADQPKVFIGDAAGDCRRRGEYGWKINFDV